MRDGCISTPSELLAAVDLLDEAQAPTAWTLEARPQQLPPEGDWFVWLIMAGRGWGKTRTGAEWLAQKPRTVRGDYAVIARSSQDLRETCLEGQSGLLRVLGLLFDSSEYNRATGQIRLQNGSNIYAYSAERPERVRGPNLSGAWCDEIAVWTFDNDANLSSKALAELRRRYEGTRIGCQELQGELIDDVEGALWSRAVIEPQRVAEVARSQLVRIVVEGPAKLDAYHGE